MTTSAPFESHHAFMVYLYEVRTLSEAVVRKCDDVFGRYETYPTEPDRRLLAFHPEVHAIIASLLNDAASLSKLLAPPSDKNGRSRLQHNFTIRRTQALMRVLRDPAITQISRVVRLRNSLEHFDDYLDRAVQKFPPAPSPSNTQNTRPVLFNAVVSKRDTGLAGLTGFLPLKVYVIEERKYVNFDGEADLAALQIECKALSEASKAALASDTGGILFWIGKNGPA